MNNEKYESPEIKIISIEPDERIMDGEEEFSNPSIGYGQRED